MQCLIKKQSTTKHAFWWFARFVYNIQTCYSILLSCLHCTLSEHLLLVSTVSVHVLFSTRLGLFSIVWKKINCLWPKTWLQTAQLTIKSINVSHQAILGADKARLFWDQNPLLNARHSRWLTSCWWNSPVLGSDRAVLPRFGHINH